MMAASLSFISADVLPIGSLFSGTGGTTVGGTAFGGTAAARALSCEPETGCTGRAGDTSVPVDPATD